MKRSLRVVGLVGLLAALVAPAGAATILLDADTPATGSQLDVAPLVTPYGTITFVDGELVSSTDLEFVAAGHTGNGFDILNAPAGPASLVFSFDVASIQFIYGGNFGGITVEARDAGNAVVDSFFQANTEDGQPAGPVTLSGAGIRSLVWDDPVTTNNLAILDNLVITPVPEPGNLALLGAGLPGLARRRRLSR